MKQSSGYIPSNLPPPNVYNKIQNDLIYKELEECETFSRKKIINRGQP